MAAEAQDIEPGSTEHRHRWSLRVGSLFGIPVYLHFTFVLLIPLFALATPDPNKKPNVALNLLWLALIFSSVLIHELAHSLVARRIEVTVDSILLLPIGGISQVRGMPKTAQGEFWMAIAGPLTSFGLAITSFLLAGTTGIRLTPINLETGSILARIAWFNLLIGTFNILPAFPMDGGRVLHSILAKRIGADQATQVAARVGQMFAILMIAVGIAFNWWLAIIGTFIFFGAIAEATVARLRSGLKGLKASDAMMFEPLTMSLDTTTENALELVRHSAQKLVPVTENGNYVGLLSVDALYRSIHPTISSLTDRSAPTFTPGSPLDQVFETLISSPYDSLAVVYGGAVVGMISTLEVERLSMQHQRDRAGGKTEH